VLASYWDTIWTLLVEPDDTKRAWRLRLTWVVWSYSDPAETYVASAALPFAGEALDLAHAQLPPCMNIAPWSP
jgi:hypothetical protein